MHGSYVIPAKAEIQEKSMEIQQIFEIQSSIYLALCWISAFAGMT
ncbi:MAG: hypothetical protein AB8U21_07445 [Rickettsia aeschlimannii]